MNADPNLSVVSLPPAGVADPAQLVDAAWAAFHSRDWDRAERTWAALRAAFPNMVIGYSAAVTTLRDAGRLEEAAAMAQAALARFPHEATAHCEAAWLVAAQGNHAAAVGLWAGIRERFPEEWVAWFGGARSLRAMGDGAGAEALLGAGAAQFPKQAVLLTEYASAAVQRHDWPEAARRWAVARQNAPDHPAGYVGGGQAARELGAADEAEAILRDAVERFPSDPAASIEYAWVAHRKRDWARAAERWTDVRARFPRHPVGYSAGAQALREAERYQEAEALLREADSLFPDETFGPTELAWLAFVRRDYAEAVRRWEYVRSLFPKLVGGYTEAIHPLRAANRLAEAEQLLVQAILRFPNEASPAIELASLALHRRDWVQADRLFSILRERFPDHI